MRDTAEKIVGREALRDISEGLRRTGATVVFANGCFDTLHVGHIRYLEGAKAEGDILVVGVNADASVGSLKGPGRPVLDENARARLVAAVRAVDYVVLFSEPTVEALLAELRPKRATSEKLGIRIAIVGDPKDHSTRSLIDSVRKAPHV